MVPCAKERWPSAVTPCWEGTRVPCVMNNKKRQGTQKQQVVSRWYTGSYFTGSSLVPSLWNLVLEAVQAYPDLSEALVPVIWASSGCILIDPGTGMSVHLSETLALETRHVLLWVLLWDFFCLSWSFREAFLSLLSLKQAVPGQPMVGSRPHLKPNLHFFPYLQEKWQTAEAGRCVGAYLEPWLLLYAKGYLLALLIISNLFKGDFSALL